MALQETILGYDRNALSLLLEKFWNIEEKLEHIDIVVSRVDISTELEDILDDKLESIADNLADKLAVQYKNK